MRPATPEARRLLDAVAALRRPYRLERSVRMVPGRLLADRFLLSLRREALGEPAGPGLAAMMAGLALPDGLREGLAEALAGADAVHLGYEAGEGGAVYKLYFEAAAAARRAMDTSPRGGEVESAGGAPGEGAPPSPERAPPHPTLSSLRIGFPAHAGRTSVETLVHLACKWRPDGQGWSTASYRWTGAMTREALATELDTLAVDAPRALGREALALALGRVAPEALMLLEVAEPENGRRSYDLNLYPAGLAVADLAPGIAAAAAALGIDPDAAGDHFRQVAGDALGHVAGGRGRDGRPFATIYHGVVDR